MTHLALRVTLVTAVACLSGCLEEFQNPTVLDSLRVLAAQVDPPEIRPDQAFDVKTLVYSPRVDNPEFRWAMCLLEAPFSRPLGGGGGGGFSERPPSEQGDPPPSCIDRENAFPPVEVLPGGGARFEVPAVVQGLLDQLTMFDIPDFDASALPEDLQGLLNLPDQFLLAVLHGINLTVSMEVSDGTETLLANKRVPVKLVPPPGAADTPVHDTAPGPVRLEFGWETDKLELQAVFPGGRPQPDDGYVLRVYMPRHFWDLETGAPAKVPTRDRGPDGAQIEWFSQGAAFQLAVDLTTDTPIVTVYEADDAMIGGWRVRPAPGLATAVLAGTTLTLTTDPNRLGGPADRPLGFLMTVAQHGELVDSIPEEGWRYVHGGAVNTNPAPPTGDVGEFPRTWRPDGLAPQDREQYPVVTTRSELVDTAESRVWSWFTDQGEWTRRRTRGEETVDDAGLEHIDAQDRENDWTPGHADDPPAVHWLVVRDGRGGVNWKDLTGVLRSAP